jgi:hypothetical protein
MKAVFLTLVVIGFALNAAAQTLSLPSCVWAIPLCGGLIGTFVKFGSRLPDDDGAANDTA